jgi:hypothetical protein
MTYRKYAENVTVRSLCGPSVLFFLNQFGWIRRVLQMLEVA